MRKFTFAAALAIPMLIGSAVSIAQQSPAAPQKATAAPNAASGTPLAAGWIAKEFADPAGVPIQSVDSFINDTCQPSGVDGIQILSLQKGHNELMNLHIYCRQDKVSSVHYKVTMNPIPDRKLGAAVNPVAGKPNVRIGAFYFGKDGDPDAFLVIEKLP